MFNTHSITAAVVAATTTQIRITARCLAVGLTFVAFSIPGNSLAMAFTSTTIDDFTIIVGAEDNRTGDAERLVSEILASSRAIRFGLSLYSRGGNILASESLAAVVSRYRIPVIIGAGEMCASGCFLVFAASPSKMFFPSSQIGVHSASLESRETMGSMAMTTTMARSASDLGVPAAIVGKMVTTPPGSMAWLSTDEVIAMGGKLLDEPTPSVPQTAEALLPAPPARVKPVLQATTSNTPGASSVKPPINSVLPDEQSQSFQEGRANRTTWEHWFATLAGDARLGAEYWTGERSKRKPGNCMGTPDFQNTCLVARQWLAGPDTKRKTDPQYRWGWNSL